MDKKKIETEYQKKIKLLLKYNKYYLLLSCLQDAVIDIIDYVV